MHGRQFGPDAVPVVGAEMNAGNFASSQVLDLNTPLDRNGALSAAPLMNGTDGHSELCCQS